MWTPFQMEIIMHHFVSSEAFMRQSVTAYAMEVDYLRGKGVLNGDMPPRVTPLGHALVNMWLNTPLPVQRFVDPRLEKQETAP